jgi:cbb3-type cytochrome oxidase subunit 3
MIRRLIGLVLSIIVAAILFILLIAFFPSRKKSVDIVNMSYIFINDD